MGLTKDGKSYIAHYGRCPDPHCPDGRKSIKVSLEDAQGRLLKFCPYCGKKLTAWRELHAVKPAG